MKSLLTKRALFFLLGGIFIGIYIAFLIDNNLFDLQSLDGPGDRYSGKYEVRENKNNLISPLLECNVNEQIGANEFGKLESNINTYVDKQVGIKTANHVSVYFRDLNNGPWIGINEQEKFSPASLLKLPLMMSYFKQAEDDPKILDKKLELSEDQQSEIGNVIQTITPGEKLQVNTSYTIDELIKRMITYSDNKAWLVLIKNQDPKAFYQTFTDMGFSIENEDLSTDFLTVKDYASFFRILFNASYLSHSNSEKALKILIETKYADGLKGKLPKNIQVAHKFGERELPDKTKQLHDCGIIYYPHHPYLLCVMTRGSEHDNLQKIIQDISKITYDTIDREYKNK